MVVVAVVLVLLGVRLLLAVGRGLDRAVLAFRQISLET
jgi:Sec-independent protein translocase protein TatA